MGLVANMKGPSGPQGSDGAPGSEQLRMSFLASTVIADPGVGKLLFNAGFDYSAVTLIAVSNFVTGFGSVKTWIATWTAGSRIRVWTPVNQNAAEFRFLDSDLSNANYAILSVEGISTTGNLSTIANSAYLGYSETGPAMNDLYPNSLSQVRFETVAANTGVIVPSDYEVGIGTVLELSAGALFEVS
jgi:hypothetical protein